MDQISFMTRVKRSAEFRFDRATVPWRNARLDQQYEANAPAVLEQIDQAITRGIEWIAPQQDVSMSVLFCAMRTLERTGDQRFAFVHKQLERYRETIRDPALIMFDDTYDPDDPEIAHIPHVQQVRPYYPVELLMLDTAWAGKREQPDILDRLKAFEDGGFYGTTHIVVGGILLLNNGGAPVDDINAMINDTVEIMTYCNDHTARAEDIFAERSMVLQWIGRHDLVKPSWMMRMVRGQLPDGGWQARNMPPVGESNQHTVAVTLATLAEFLHHHRVRN